MLLSATTLLFISPEVSGVGLLSNNMPYMVVIGYVYNLCFFFFQFSLVST